MNYVKAEFPLSNIIFVRFITVVGVAEMYSFSLSILLLTYSEAVEYLSCF